MHSHSIFSSQDFCFHCKLHRVFSLQEKKIFTKIINLLWQQMRRKMKSARSLFVLLLFCFASTCAHIAFQKRYIPPASECMRVHDVCKQMNWITPAGWTAMASNFCDSNYMWAHEMRTSTWNWKSRSYLLLLFVVKLQICCKNTVKYLLSNELERYLLYLYVWLCVAFVCYFLWKFCHLRVSSEKLEKIFWYHLLSAYMKFLL